MERKKKTGRRQETRRLEDREAERVGDKGTWKGESGKQREGERIRG